VQQSAVPHFNVGYLAAWVQDEAQRSRFAIVADLLKCKPIMSPDLDSVLNDLRRMPCNRRVRADEETSQRGNAALRQSEDSLAFQVL
jgi:hypothetical protein